ncbi:MAG: hypothetical protein EKK37_10435 [Sphingobacteriales bacterium]|nr:MAG: hypothetical protein EKK37_10435 [Sphingobacteriales bacterium]
MQLVTDLKMNSSTELKSIEVREGWKGYYVFAFGIWAFGIVYMLFSPNRQKSLDFIFSDWTLAKLPTFIVLFGLPSLCLFYYFDKRVKIKIDKEGIWTRRNKLIPWSDIWYFSSTVCKMREGDLYYLKLRLKDTEERLDKEIKLRLRRMDKDFQEIREVVEYHALQNNIHDMGHEEET